MRLNLLVVDLEPPLLDQICQFFDRVAARLDLLRRHLLDDLQKRRIIRRRDAVLFAEQDDLAIEKAGLGLTALRFQIHPGRRIGS